MTLKPASLQWSDDGTLRSLDYGDIYFQPGKGREESDYVFLSGNRLPERFQKLEKDTFYVAELGFGSGLNFLLTAALFLEKAPARARLIYVSVEKHPIAPADLQKIYTHWPDLSPLSAQILAQYPPAVSGIHILRLMQGRVTLTLALGDIADILPDISGKFDAWYLDGFSPEKNPGMWQEKLFPMIAAKTAPRGTVSTFSAAGAVRRGLESAGFTVTKEKGFGTKRDMTTGFLDTSSEITQKKPKTVSVIGAGIAGCSAAHALALKGFDVTLIDRHSHVAAETSGNSVAVLYPKMTVDQSPAGIFHRHAFCFARETVRRLQLKSWQECGVLHLDTDMEVAALHQKIIERNGYPEDFAWHEPGAGLHQPSAGMLSPVEFCEVLSAHPKIQKKLGENIKELPAGITVIASGYESKTQAVTSWLPLQSLRGQVTMAKATAASAQLSHIACYEGYITPAIDGVHCFGATFHKEDLSDFSVREEDHLENLAKLNKYLPALSLKPDDIVGGRTGYRAATPDRLPMIGPCPDYIGFQKIFSTQYRRGNPPQEKPYIDNLYVSTGFSAHGMTGAVLAGEIIACMIAGDPLPIPESLMEYILPERFILRDLKRGKI